MSDQGNHSELLECLQELATLSENHGYSWHADYVRETISAFRKSDADGWDHLVSIQFWGGSGSICDSSYSPNDVAWHKENDRPVPEYLQGLSPDGHLADNNRQMQLLSRIAKLIPASCSQQDSLSRWFDRAKGTSEIYDKWLSKPTAQR